MEQIAVHIKDPGTGRVTKRPQCHPAVCARPHGSTRKITEGRWKHLVQRLGALTMQTGLLSVFRWVFHRKLLNFGDD